MEVIVRDVFDQILLENLVNATMGERVPLVFVVSTLLSIMHGMRSKVVSIVLTEVKIAAIPATWGGAKDAPLTTEILFFFEENSWLSDFSESFDVIGVQMSMAGARYFTLWSCLADLGIS